MEARWRGRESMEMVEPGVGSRRHVVNADLRALGEQVGEK